MKRRKFECSDCGHSWVVEVGTPCPSACPRCGRGNVGLAAREHGEARDFTRARRQRRGHHPYDEEEQEDEYDTL